MQALDQSFLVSEHEYTKFNPVKTIAALTFPKDDGLAIISVEAAHIY